MLGGGLVSTLVLGQKSIHQIGELRGVVPTKSLGRVHPPLTHTGLREKGLKALSTTTPETLINDTVPVLEEQDLVVEKELTNEHSERRALVTREFAGAPPPQTRRSANKAAAA